MSYEGVEKIKANLPLEAHTIEPIDGWPITAQNKVPVPVRCTVCGFTFKKSWDNLTHPDTDCHCSVCRYMEKRLAAFNALDLNFKAVSYQYAPELDKVNNKGKTGLAQYGAKVVIEHKPCGNQFTVNANTIKAIATRTSKATGAKSLNCEFCAKNMARKHREDLIEAHASSPEIKRAQRIWGGDIVAKGAEDGIFLSIPSFNRQFPLGEIPVSAILDPNVTGRLKGPLEGVFTERGLKGLLDDDERDMHNTQSLIDDAPNYGARMYFVCYRGPDDNHLYQGSGTPGTLPSKSAIYYQYQKATKYMSNWQTIHRVLDTCFGRTGIKQQQLMVACVLHEIFPINEHGEEVKWQEDNKTVFGGLELDIRSLNLLPHLGGVQCEYQGHQSHRECEKTIARDQFKIDNAKGFYFTVDNVNHMTAQKALDAVERSIAESDFPNKDVILSLRNKFPSVDRIRGDFEGRLPDRAMASTIRLKKKMEELGHRLINEQMYYLYSEDCEYECGQCGSLRNTKVMNILHSPSKYCADCKGELNKGLNKDNRCSAIRATYGEFKEVVEPITIGQLLFDRNMPQLTQAQRKMEEDSNSNGDIACAQCGALTSKKRYIESLSDYKTFVCTCCFNTGKFIAEGAELGITMGSIWQSLPDLLIVYTKLNEIHPIDDITKHLSLIPKSKQTKYASGLKLNWTSSLGHTQSYPLPKWVELLKQDKKCFCSDCYTLLKERSSKAMHDERLQTFHPNGEYLGSLHQSNLVEATCHEVTQIGKFEITHPSFYISTKKMQGVAASKSYGEYSACLCCSDEKGWKVPSSDKTIEQLEARLKLRAAKVATVLGEDSIENVSITFGEKSKAEIVKSSDVLTIKCQNPAHAPTKRNFNNFFSPHKKGYCSECLKACGVKLFSEL